MDANEINGLADKLEAVDLTDAERALLDGILARAAMAEPDEVVGHALGGLGGLEGLSPRAEPFAAALGVLGSSPRTALSNVEYGRSFDA